MNYSEIIKENSAKCENHWWPKLAFHYTDVKNAVSILSSEFLYSRIDAEKLGIMHNDNASRQVIDSTKLEAKSHVRFYFRPLTPTQYYNEGYKHSDIRYNDDNFANIPIPVFFAFDLEKLLSLPKTKFSKQSQAGHGDTLFDTPEDFAKLPFDKIYSNGYSDNWQNLIKYRHAEIVYPDRFNINTCLNAILCRNNVERTTLLNLLKANNLKNYYKFKPSIKLCREGMFQNNGLFVGECQFHDNTVSVSFTDTLNKHKYCYSEMKKHGLETLEKIRGRLDLTWLSGQDMYYSMSFNTAVNYVNPVPLTVTNLPTVKGAKTIRIQFYLENNLMCYIEQPLNDVELFK